MNLTSQQIKSLIISRANELGFVKTGFAKYEVLENQSEQLRKWLDEGYDADMKWIGKGFEKRKDIRLIMEDAKSVISLASNYFTPFEHDDTKPKISRYAWGKDYHKVLKTKLKELCTILETQGIRTRAYVDDGPVMDKVWAQKAGIGWMGKHTNIINPEYGSWIFLCEIITNIEFDNYDEPVEDLCGSCSLCVSSCPTGAITEEYIVDANKCISYQTIENHGEIPAEINLDGWIFGCDVCQDVCPYNSPKYNHVTSDENFYPSATALPLTKGEYPQGEGVLHLESITEDDFNTIFADSPVKRTKFSGWKRNLEKLKT
jgi:epoxyqueuosine reductase